jgi:hypothetical protein
MLLTRLVQLVLFTGVGIGTVLAVRVFIQDHRDHRKEVTGKIPVDYSGEIRRKMEKR